MDNWLFSWIPEGLEHVSPCIDVDKLEWDKLEWDIKGVFGKT